MEALMQTGAQIVGGSVLPAKNGSTSNVCSCSSVAGCSLQSASPKSAQAIRLHVLGRSKLRQKFLRSREPYNGPLMPFRIRVEQASGGGGSVGEKIRGIASEETVEGPGNEDRNAKLKTDKLHDSVDEKSPAESTELPVAAELLLQTLKAEDESAEEAVAEQDVALDVASDSAVEDPETFFHDVEQEAQQVAANLGRTVEDVILGLEDKADDLEERQQLETDLVKGKEFREGETSIPMQGDLPSTRAEAQEKFMQTARDGYEVLKWAAEGLVSAGKNARQGLAVARKAFDTRVKSFNIAADETKHVSSQVAEAVQKKFGQIHSSTSQFEEELQVNLDDKKAADSLKPEYERNPLTKLGHETQENFNKATSEDSPLGHLGQGVRENYNKVTSEDGPLAHLKETVTENLSKASQAGRDFSTRISERAAELSSKSSEGGAETTDKVKENAGEFASPLTSSFRNGDARDHLKRDYEDERGNELLQGQISNNDDKTTLNIDADEPQAIPSKKEDGSDIGHDE